MHCGRIDGATRKLGPPSGWDKERDGFCGTLTVRDDNLSCGPAMASAWFPTEEEIARIVAGAPIYLYVMGGVHPPVGMAVGPAPDNSLPLTGPAHRT